MVSKEIWEQFNSLKKQGWEAKTQAEWDNVKASIKELFNNVKTGLLDSDRVFLKESIAKQVSDIDAKKKAFFEKNSGHPVINKTSYIFREQTDASIGRLADALARWLDRQ